MFTTILVSILTSLTVSIITFIVGLRVGKNQADRRQLKEYFRNLCIHFEVLLNSIENGKPKTWDDFRKPNWDESIPLVKGMKKDGTIIDLPDRLAEKLENIEFECLKFGFNFQQLLLTVRDKGIEILNAHSNKPIVTEDSDISNSPKRNGNKFFESYLGGILIKDVVKKMCDWLQNDPQSGINLLIHQNSRRLSFYIYPSGLKNIEIVDFLKKFHEISLEIPNVHRTLDIGTNIGEEIRKVLPRLRQLSRDPHPFWETLLCAFKDVFKK